MKPAIHIGDHRVWNIDARQLADVVEPESVQCCVTSPPYWGLRNYGVDGQIGLEASPDEYVDGLVEVFRGVRRMLRPDGVLLLNLGDSYAATTKGAGGIGKQTTNAGSLMAEKPKDLVGVPWMVAFALRADGWWLRQDIIWAKPNPMPESVKDRCTKAHEYVFLLSKAANYFWNADAIRETHTDWRPSKHGATAFRGQASLRARGTDDSPERYFHPNGRNARSVWTIATAPFSGAHFATMAPALARRCILASSRPGDTVADPFAGALTTAVEAHRTERASVGSELSAEYVEIGRRRLADATAQQTLGLGQPPVTKVRRRALRSET